MKRNNRIFLFAFLFVIGIAGFLRLYKLGSVPASPDWDEAALGYNAYSILKTGKDEYGTLFPLSIRSYDDYKPPLYVYLTVPSVAVFGLNVWAVRLPSAVMGIIAVIGVYFLVVELFLAQKFRISIRQPTDIFQINKKDTKNKKNTVPFIALLSSLLLAISPWHLQFSRIAFEANIGVTLNIWASYFFLRGVTSAFSLSLSAFLFALSLYAYHSERIFVPLLVLLLAFACRKHIFGDKKKIGIAFAVGLLTVLPALTVFFNPTALTRLKGTSTLSDQTGLLMRSVAKLQDDLAHRNQLGKVFDNRRVVWVTTLLDGYLSHFSLRWLYLSGDNPRHHAPDMGLLYFIELPFFLWGMIRVFRKGGIPAIVLFGWFFLAPVAASPTSELPHAIRTLVFLPSFQIFTAAGLFDWWQFLQKRRNAVVKIGLTGVFGLACLVNILYYFHMYYSHMNREFSEYWQYGYKETVEYIKEHKGEYSKIVVSTKLEQPHMFFLFYLSYDPVKYLSEGGTASGGFKEIKNRFDMFEFRPIHWEEETKDGKTLFVGLPSEMTVPNKKLISYLDGSPAVAIADK